MLGFRYCFVILTLFVLLATGCQSERTPQGWFDLTWAGLAGADALLIQGEAEIIQNEERKKGQTFTYTASLENHTKLTVKVKPSSDMRMTRLDKQNIDTHESTAAFHLDKGNRWVMVPGTDLSNTLASTAGNRLNPLSAIEELRNMKKNIWEERGAARGTRTLRIEPDSEQERLRLEQQLDAEINHLQTAWKTHVEGRATVSELNKLSAAGDEVILSNKKALQQLLATAKVHTVYHLTINKKNNLPIKLMAETNLTYQDTKGTSRTESLWNNAKFTNYH